MPLPNDPVLIHGRAYDPAKAHEYYLRNRKLKGRNKGSTDSSSPGGSRPRASSTAGRRQSSKHARLEAEKAALENRLERLRDVLAQLVEAAKKRSGVETKPTKKNSPDKKSSQKESKKDSKLSVSEKKEKAEKAREEYQKEHGMSTSQEVQQLQGQIADIRAQIQAAIQDARQKSSQRKPQTASKGR